MRHPSTIFSKANICFSDWFGWERVVKISICTAQITIHLAVDEFLSSNTSKFETPPIGKVVSSKRRTTFILADFEVFRRNLENAPKVLEIGMDIREFDRCLTRV
jgi:hypothetical protein